MSRTARVPAALHSELTEYASLLRALRTTHSLDLSAHLSQLPPRSSQPIEDDESELSRSDEDDENEDAEQRGVAGPSRSPGAVGDKSEFSDARLRESVDPRQSVSPTPPIRKQFDAEGHETVHNPGRMLQSQDAEQRAPLPRKKRKRTTTDTWTRWPLLAGDVHRPEWGLADEVQLIASHMQRQQRSCISPEQDSDSDADADSEEEEVLGDVGSRAVASSTAAHLRMLFSVCSAHVPRVEPSLRTRLAPLNWAGVLAAAGTSGLVPPETLERVGARLEALFSNSTSTPVEDSQRNSCSLSQAIPSTPCTSATRPAHTAAVVRNARENLRALVAARVEQGDGDFLSFAGPRPPPEITRKRKRIRRSRMKVESELEDALVKKENTDERHEESVERQRTQSASNEANGDEAESVLGEEN